MDILEIPITMMYCPFYRKKAEVVINPTTGKIISVNQLQLKNKKIMQRVKLMIKQYYFLQNLIKQSIITNVFYKDNHIVIIELSEDDMDKIRDLALDYLDIYGFDKDYELTESGILAEELVDKLYT